MRDTHDARETPPAQEDNHPSGVASVRSPSCFCSPYAVHRKTHSVLMEYECSWEQLLADQDLMAAVQSRDSMFKVAGGRTVPVQWVFKDMYRDEYTQEPLPEAPIREAIVDELSYFNSEVWVGWVLRKHNETHRESFSMAGL